MCLSSAGSSRRSFRGGQTFRLSRFAPLERTTRSIGSATRLVVRLPRNESRIGPLEKERRWLPRLAPLLPLPIPVPLAQGMPAEDYPWEWSVYRWLEGETATVERITDLGPSGDRSGAVRGRLAAGRSHGRAAAWGAQLLSRCAAGNARRCDPRCDRLPSRRDRRRCGDRGMGISPSVARVGAPACLDPRRPLLRKPAGHGGTAQRRHRLRVSRRGRSRMRLDGRVDAPLRREPGGVPRSVIGR